MKLQTKIHLFSSVFMLILIVLINTAIYFLFYKVSADSELDQLAGQTDVITETLNKNPDIAEEELLKAFLPNDGMIRVIDKDSTTVIPTLTKKNEYRRLASSYTTTENRKMDKTANQDNVAVIEKPIIWDNGDIVTLQVSKHLVILQENMKILFYVLLFASVVMLIPILIGANILSRFLLNPIKALTGAMKENATRTKWKKIKVHSSKSKDELYEMEKTFNEMIERLSENFQKQDVFVSDASHELKTPISIVKSYAQLLSRRGLEHPDLFYESVEAIETEADRMQKLVEQMLNLAKSQLKTELQDVDFLILCSEVIKIFQGAASRDIEFTTSQQGFIVKGDRDRLEQVVYILIDNALKYSDNSIDVHLTHDAEWVTFTVTDYGQGIPVDEQGRIFDRFYRVDKARSRETGGTGLGLPIAKEITEAHHGELKVTSQIGKGTTFILKIPLSIKN